MYLGVNFDSLYGKRAVKEFGGEPVVIVVEVEKELLSHDNNALTYGDLSRKDLSKKELLHKSLSALFPQCIYEGIISPEKILAVYDFSGKKIN